MTVVTAFAAADTETARRIADMAGEVWEMRESQTLRRPRPLLWAHGSTTAREERRALLLPGDVRALPRDEALVFVAGAKPIRAKKLRFDREPVFVERLLPPARKGIKLTTAHDWAGVRAVGARPAAAKPPARRTGPRPVLAAASSARQPDLFPPPPGSIAQRARDGFVDDHGAPLPHPSGAVPAAPAADDHSLRRTGP